MKFLRSFSDFARKAKARGFTLIELLVVIAIIALLASIILASLNSARQKGGDATIQGDLDSIRSQAEIDYSTWSPNGYTSGSNSICTTDPTITSALNSAASAGGTGTVVTAIGTAATLSATNASAKGACHASATAYAVEMPLDTSSLNAWCVDSTGKAEQTSTALAASSAACP